MQQPSVEEIEYWLAKEFNYRQNIVVPNVSWGLGLHECDLLVLRPSGYAAEIEIKRSLSDLKAEAKKNHIHASDKIREFWFAVPDEMKDEALSIISEHPGLLTYRPFEYTFTDGVVSRLLISRVRSPRLNTAARKFTPEERQKLLALAHMRIWTMKRQMARANKQS
ncbi:MAG: hypothetical protein LWW75_06450 [Chlorobiales bacterium]|nr:hypothetical protein [Chlorobiales bacterium]